MRVYIVTIGEYCQGHTPIAVFDSLEKARNKAFIEVERIQNDAQLGNAVWDGPNYCIIDKVDVVRIIEMEVI